jgi:hypothetical protein
MRTKKRPQYVTDLLKKVNQHLREFKVKEEHTDNLFIFMCDYLLTRDMYRGYNFYKDMYNPYKGEVVPVLAGSAKKDEYDYLQIW